MDSMAGNSIRGIAFDLGNVLFDFDYNIALEKIKPYIKVPAQAIVNSVFNDGCADDFERGNISAEDFFIWFKEISGYQGNFKEFSSVWSDIFVLNEQTFSLIKSIKPFYSLFLISNINELHYNFLKNKYTGIFSIFDHEILSYKVRSTKPDPHIYNHLLSESGFQKEELVYIDDREDLIKAATKQGFNCILFNNTDDCIRRLAGYRVYISDEKDSKIFNRLLSFVSAGKTALLGLGNELRGDDYLAGRLINNLENKVAIKTFNPGTVPENISLKELKNIDKILVVDSSPNMADNFKVCSLNDVFSLKPFSTHTSLIFFEFLKKSMNLDILFLVVNARQISFKDTMSKQVLGLIDILEKFFIKNYPKFSSANNRNLLLIDPSARLPQGR